MKKAMVCTMTSMIISTLCLSQTVTQAVPDSLTKIYETDFDQEAQFPKGAEAWKNYLQNNLRGDVPTKNGAPEGTYKVIVRFIVAIDGTLSDFTPVTNFGFGMEDELIRVIKKGPKWEPAKRYGRKIKTFRKQPLTFLVSSE